MLTIALLKGEGQDRTCHCPKFLAPGGEKGHGKDPLAGGLAALYLLPYLMGPISLMSCYYGGGQGV